MEFQLLGPVGAVSRTGAVDLGTPRQRCLVAALAWTAGRPVAVDVLVEQMWGSWPPRSARDTLYAYVTRLRRALRPHQVEVRRDPGGYVIGVSGDQVDWLRFRGLVDRAAGAANDDAVALLREALSLWRGRALADLAGSWVDRVRATTEQHLLAARTRLAAAELRRGNHEAVVAELAGWTQEHPLAEGLVEQHMLALYRSGRVAEACAAFAGLRTRMVEELGVEPGRELRELHRRMLDRDPEITLAARERPPRRPGSLPPDIADFTGRQKETAYLRELLCAGGAAVPTAAITGRSGVGKTALAVHTAHAVADRFPDGQLYATLGTGTSAVPPGVVLVQFLRALGVGDAAIPDGVEERSTMLRDHLSGRRLLVVLDNALGEAQVRPLLPGSPTCAVLITSRAAPSGLAGVRLVDLDVFDVDQGLHLLDHIIGRERTAADPDGARELLRLCGHLPLAVRIVGARLAARPHWTPSTLAARLLDDRRRLTELSVGDLEVRVGLDSAYHQLEPEARRALRLLGVLGVPDFACWLPAAALDLAPPRAEDVVDQLVGARLVDVTAAVSGEPVRFGLHELVRVHARERAVHDGTEDDIRCSLRRLITELTAFARNLGQGLVPAATSLLRRDVGPPRLLSVSSADRENWFAAEEQTLIALVERAAELGLDDEACGLAEALVFCWFGPRNRFTSWERSYAAALTAAERAGKHGVRAALMGGLGQMRYKQDRFAESADCFRRAVDLHLAGRDEHGAAVARVGLGTVHREVGRHADALAQLVPAETALAAAGDLEALAHARYGIGFCHRERGDDRRATSALRAAEQTYREIGHRTGVALALRGVGLVHRARGEYGEASTCANRPGGPWTPEPIPCSPPTSTSPWPRRGCDWATTRRPARS